MLDDNPFLSPSYLIRALEEKEEDEEKKNQGGVKLTQGLAYSHAAMSAPVDIPVETVQHGIKFWPIAEMEKKDTVTDNIIISTIQHTSSTTAQDSHRWEEKAPGHC